MIPRPGYRFWMGRAGLAGIFLLVILPCLHLVQNHVTARLVLLTKRVDETRASIKQLDDDISLTQSIHTAKERYDVLSALEPVDRLQTTNLLEHQAAIDQLNHFSFALSPEQKQTIDSPAGPQSLSVSIITVSGDAMLDGDVYAYLDHLRQSLPGWLRLSRLVIERVSGEEKSGGVHFTATFDWLSNGTEKILAGDF